MMKIKSLHRATGYTLIETLIALFVLTTALLGFAALSTQALQATRGALNHDFATLQAIDLAERMRANPAGLAIYPTLSGTPSGTDCTTATCDPTDMARFDLREWNQRNEALLPSGSGQVSLNDSLYQITIDWLEGTEQKQHTLELLLQ